MALKNTVIKGAYGYYFPYVDDAGKERGLKILDYVYNYYYAPGYLTDQHIIDMLAGKTISFSTPNKNGSGVTEHTANIVPYRTQAGRDTFIIQFNDDKVTDHSVLNANASKILEAYAEHWSYTKPQLVVNTLNLEKVWKTFAKYYLINGYTYGVVKLYRQNARKDDSITLYCRVDKNKNFEVVDEAQYKADCNTQKELNDAEELKRKQELQEYEAARAELEKEITDLYDKIWTSNTMSQSDLIANIEPLVASITISDEIIKNAVFYEKFDDVNSIFREAKTDIKYNFKLSNYKQNNTADLIKTSLFNKLKLYVEAGKIESVRTELYKEYNDNGLEALVEPIDIDIALSLGYFPTVQKVLVKYKNETPKYIINKMYRECIDKDELKDKLLNLLKIFYDFYNMPEKDLKSVAKFIAKNKITDYYEQIRQYDLVLETLIDNSRDPRLTKPLLESIAGTSRADVLKTKTFYFEKTGRISPKYKLNKPLEFLDNLKELIKEFNTRSDVAILTNIELNADETFVFQFYTFAEAEGDEKGFDGRRMLNLTRIYNRYHPKERVGFIFDNDFSSDEADGSDSSDES